MYQQYTGAWGDMVGRMCNFTEPASCQYAAPPGTPGFDPHETELLGTNGLKRLTEVVRLHPSVEDG